MTKIHIKGEKQNKNDYSDETVPQFRHKRRQLYIGFMVQY